MLRISHLPMLALFVAISSLSCQRTSSPSAPTVNTELPDKLSELGLFDGPLAAHKPAAGVFAYDLNTPLFSDYTLKYRFIKLPPGECMTYQGDENALAFPHGTIIAKTFAYPLDQRDPNKGQRLLETRILRHEQEGWSGVSYLWNEAQTEATVKLTGAVTKSHWVHFDGQERNNAYIIPNANQCKGCHGANNDPIGPKPRNLQRDTVQSTKPENQLQRWIAQGILKNVESNAGITALPRWDDEHASLDERARAWLDVNCAHCHNPAGPAKQSGLDLRYTQDNPVQRGVMKLPVAAGRGSGGRLYDIVPGKPDESILVYRLESTEPGVMMPELPRRMVDQEGVKLIRDWISSMK